MDTASVLVNLISFQIGWFFCVLSAAAGWPWAGTSVAAVVVALHVSRAALPMQELKLIAKAVLVGLIWDSLLVNLGLITFPSGLLFTFAAPHWILALWAMFATTLNVSLRWLRRRWVVAALLGSASGPLSYWAGAKLGALVLPDVLSALLILGLGWAVMTPLLLARAQRHDGISAAA